MNETDSLRFYKAMLAPHLKPYAEKACKLFMCIKPVPEPLRKNFDAIQRIALHLHEDRKVQKDLSPILDFFPGSFLKVEKRIKRIFPEIKKIRMELFGKEKAPFDYDQALKWLKEEAKKEAIEFYKKNRFSEAQKLKDEIRDLVDELNKIDEWDHGLGSKLVTLPIFLKNGLQDDLRTFPGTRLRKLAWTIKYFSQQFDLSEFSILMFIFADIKPILPSVSISRITSTHSGRKIELEIFRPLSQKEFTSLFKPISKFLPQRKRITMENLKVFEFIKKKGGVPLTGKMKFWRDALKEWNKAHPKNKYSSSRSLRMTYLRIKQKI